MHTQDQGNNETASRGICELHGRFTALDFGQSKTFKTRAGAEAWLGRRGINPDGSRIERAGGSPHWVDQETAYGQTTRLPFQVRVF